MKRFEGRPFAIIGVNSDRNREALKKTIKKENLNWRSFWDGGSTTGPIATKWNVSGWPTVYLIDHKGVIRGKFMPSDEVLDNLVKAAESK